jgi:hypothetical protein
LLRNNKQDSAIIQVNAPRLRSVSAATSDRLDATRVQGGNDVVNAAVDAAYAAAKRQLHLLSVRLF